MFRGLLFSVALVAAAPIFDKPTLTLRVFPQMQIADVGTGCGSVLITAELKGPEDEKWYCPKVEWEYPGDTKASEESDCAPFDERTEYPRTWRKRLRVPAHPYGESWSVWVRLSKDGRLLSRQEIKFWVKG